MWLTQASGCFPAWDSLRGDHSGTTMTSGLRMAVGWGPNRIMHGITLSSRVEQRIKLDLIGEWPTLYPYDV